MRDSAPATETSTLDDGSSSSHLPPARRRRLRRRRRRTHKLGISACRARPKDRSVSRRRAREHSSINLISRGIGGGDRRDRIASRPFGRRPSCSRQRPTCRLAYISTSPSQRSEREGTTNWFISASDATRAVAAAVACWSR